MSPESLTETHNRYVEKVCSIFVRIASPKHRFAVQETCLTSPTSATIPHGTDVVHFDIFLIHETGGRTIHYCVECKTRSECSPSTSSDLKSHLKIFLQKAYNTVDWLDSRYPGDYGYMFISKVPFGVSDDNLTFDYIRNALDGSTTPDSNRITKLISKVRIMVFSEWYANLFKEE